VDLCEDRSSTVHRERLCVCMYIGISIVYHSPDRELSYRQTHHSISIGQYWPDK